MKAVHLLFENAGHKWLAIARDPDGPDWLADTNEYLVVTDQDALLLDPGGSERFPAVFSVLATQIDPGRIGKVFATNQDPDTISSLSMWTAFNPDIKCYVSRLWSSQISHLGSGPEVCIDIPDAGMELQTGALRLRAIPAHHLHSPGSFHLYDGEARILFSGDVGTAILPPDEGSLFVENFDRHIRHAEAFHRRWMGSERAKREWCTRVSQLDVDMLCPHRGAIYRGADVKRFIDWFSHLEVGIID